MKEMIKKKFGDNPFERFMFYVACVHGVVSSIWVMNRAERFQQDEWYIQVAIVVALLFTARAAHSYLWWFGDHPEEE